MGKKSSRFDNGQFIHLVPKIEEKHLPIPYSVPTFTQLDPSECCRFVELILNLKQLGLFVIRLSNDDIYYKLFHENKRQKTKKINKLLIAEGLLLDDNLGGNVGASVDFSSLYPSVMRSYSNS